MDDRPNDAASVLDDLGSRVASLAYEDLTESGLHLFRIALVDTLGVALAGADFDAAAIARAVAVPDTSGTSLILGSTDRVSALDAGMLNGIAAHALDYDDGNQIMGGHPSALLIPALLALGEEVGASAREVIVAYAAGFEVMIRLSRGVNTAHYEKGWHPTSTIGVLGVAAAGARLLGLTAAQCYDGPGDLRIDGRRNQGQFRHDGQVVTRRPCRARRAAVRQIGRSRIHRQQVRA